MSRGVGESEKKILDSPALRFSIQLFSPDAVYFVSRFARVKRFFGQGLFFMLATKSQRHRNLVTFRVFVAIAPKTG